MTDKSTMSAIRVLATVGVISLATSCRTARQPPMATRPSTLANVTSRPSLKQTDTLRALCTAAWARKLVGNDYAKYEACSPADKRKNIFGIVFQAIDTASRYERISGNQCLDLFGQPDRWLHALSGDIVLVYFYSWNGQQKSAMISLDPDGYVKYCGYNTAGANNWDGWEKG